MPTNGPKTGSVGASAKRSLSTSLGGDRQRGGELLSPTSASRVLASSLRHNSLAGAGLPLTPGPLSPGGQAAALRQDSLSQLAALVEAGEPAALLRGAGDSGETLNGGRMPPPLAAELQEANLHFLHHRHLFSADYTHFVASLVENVTSALVGSDDEAMAIQTLHFALRHLCQFAWHTPRRIRGNAEMWLTWVGKLVAVGPGVGRWLCQWLVEGKRGPEQLKAFLFLEAALDDVRKTFARIVFLALQSQLPSSAAVAESEAAPEMETAARELLSRGLLPAMGSTAVELWGRSSAFWAILLDYAKLEPTAAEHLLRERLFSAILDFLLQPEEKEQQGPLPAPKPSPDRRLIRRWTNVQAKELKPVYELLAILLLHSAKRSDRAEDVEAALSGQSAVTRPLVQELVWAYLDVPGLESLGSKVLTAGSKGCEDFSRIVIGGVLTALGEMHSLYAIRQRRLSSLTSSLLKMDDGLEHQRAQWILDGFGTYPPGLLHLLADVADSNGRRRYALLKLMVHLASVGEATRAQLDERTDRWQWAVHWLADAMAETAADEQRDQTDDLNSVAPTTSKRGNNTNNNNSGGTSNEEAGSRSFVRTVSAQYTLENARGLLRASEPGSPDEAGSGEGGSGEGGSGEGGSGEGGSGCGEGGSGGSSSVVEMECSSSSERSGLAAPDAGGSTSASSSTLTPPGSPQTEDDPPLSPVLNPSHHRT